MTVPSHGRSTLCGLVACLLLPAAASAQTWNDFQVGGLTRKALVYVPDGIDAPPLLISLHGMGIGAGWHQGGMMKFEPIADREKFIVVYPEADQDLRWDLGGTHDIDFMLEIIEQMSAQYGIDRNRVYASGFSMGGMFSYTLACKLPNTFAAIAPGNGYPLGGQFGCDTSRPVPIFHMHGTADDFVAYAGIHAFLQSKITAYRCPSTPVRTEPYPVTSPTSMSFKETWGPCVDATGQPSEVVLVSVTGMIHDWATAEKANANEDPTYAGKPFDIDGSEEAWAYLKQHSLDGSGFAGADAGVDAGAPDAGAGVSAVAGAGAVVADPPPFAGTGGAAAPVGGTGGIVPAPAGTTAVVPMDEFIPGLEGSRNDADDSSGCAVHDVSRNRPNASCGAWGLLLLAFALRIRGHAGADRHTPAADPTHGRSDTTNPAVGRRRLLPFVTRRDRSR